MLEELSKSLYWSGCYLERLNHLLKISDDILKNFPEYSDSVRLSLLENSFFYWGEPQKTPLKLPSNFSIQDWVDLFIFSETNSHSIYSCLLKLRKNINNCSCLFSHFILEQINIMFYSIKNLKRKVSIFKIIEIQDLLRKTIYSIYGIVDCEIKLSSGEMRLFYSGVFAERFEAYYRSLLFRMSVVSQYSDLKKSEGYWLPFLDSLALLKVYRRVHHVLEFKRLIHFMIFSEECAQSLISILYKLSVVFGDADSETKRRFSDVVETLRELEIDLIQGKFAYSRDISKFLSWVPRKLSVAYDNVEQEDKVCVVSFQ